MEAILSKVWSDTSKPPDQHVAWAISVVQTILNPKNSDIKITEDIVKYQLSINIVSICNITCKNILKINEILYKNRKK
jgi:C4-dicarboxylate transporter